MHEMTNAVPESKAYKLIPTKGKGYLNNVLKEQEKYISRVILSQVWS